MQREVGVMYLGGSGDEGWELMENCLSVFQDPPIRNISYTRKSWQKNKIFIRMYRMHDVELHLE